VTAGIVLRYNYIARTDKDKPPVGGRFFGGTGLASKTVSRNRRRKAAERRPVDQAALAGIVGYRLRLAQLHVFKDFLKTFEDLAIRPIDYSILRLIETNPGVRQGELARALGVKRANMVSLIHGLEERGLARRRTVNSDKRANALHLTKAGKAFVTEMQKIWQAHEDRVVARLGGGEARKQLLAILDKLAPLH
jgi:DNA-binding MarR family transcriptional regulator